MRGVRSALDVRSITRLAVELAQLTGKGTLTDAQRARRSEIVATLRAAGVQVNLAVEDVTPTKTFVPEGDKLGADGVVRNPRFGQQYRREVARRAQHDPRYRREALALARPACDRRPVVVVHAPERREFRPKPRGARSHRARAPARPSDEPAPEPSDLVVVPLAAFRRAVVAWKAGA